MRIIYIVSLMVISVFFWSILDGELYDYFAIIFMWVAVASATLAVFKEKIFYFFIAMSFGIVILMHMCHKKVISEADAFAARFLANHKCAPTINELTNEDNRWKKNREIAAIAFRFNGASRLVSYQQNGLFRYGFFDEERRTVWLSKCRIDTSGNDA